MRPRWRFFDGYTGATEKASSHPATEPLGKHGSIAVIERLILTLKGLLRCLPRVPLRSAAFRLEVQLTIDWYNEHRPHTTLHGRTPNEVYLNRFPANRTPRFELRECWPLGAPCSSPWALVRESRRKGPVRCRIPRREHTLARCVHQACRVAEDDECLRASAIVLCTGSVEQPPLKLFVVRLAKDLLGLRGNGVHGSPISVRMSTSLTTVTWGSILRHAGRQNR